jgi:hypothetical protein
MSLYKKSLKFIETPTTWLIFPIYTIFALLLAIVLVHFLFASYIPSQPYKQLVAGVLSHQNISKVRDIYFIYAVIFLTPALAFFLLKIPALYHKVSSSQKLTHLFSLGPILLFILAYLLFCRIFPNTFYALNALLAGSLSLLLFNINNRSFRFRVFDIQNTIFIFSLLLISTVFIYFNRLTDIDFNPMSGKYQVLFIGAILAGIAFRIKHSSASLFTYLLGVTYALSFSCIYLIEDFSLNIGDYSHWGKLKAADSLVVISIVLTTAHHYWLWKNREGNNSLKFIPLYPVAICLAYLFSSSFPIITIPSDDFHFGEFLTPWAMLKEFGLLPFVDTTPVRGLINYLPASLSELLYNGTISGLFYSFALIHAVFIGLYFAILRKFLPVSLLLIFSFFLPISNGLYEGEFLSVLLIVYSFSVLRNAPSPGLIFKLYVFLVASILFMNGQGVLAAISVTAMAIYYLMTDQLFRNELLKNKSAVRYAILSLLLLLIISPLLIPIATYIYEQSIINQAAYGLKYFDEFGLANYGRYTGELIRSFGFIIITISLSLLVHNKFRIKVKKYYPLLIALFIYSLLYINRAYVRTDSDSFSRMGTFTFLIVTIAMPLALIRFRLIAKQWGIIISVICISWFSYQMAGNGNFTNDKYRNKFADQKLSGSESQHSTYGSNAIFEINHWKNIQDLKYITDATSTKGDVIINLTNRNALAFYLNRVSFFETGSFYTSSNLSSQSRIVNKLKGHNYLPPVIVSSLNAYFDYYSPSLRAPLVYEKIISNQFYELISYKDNYLLVDSRSPYYKNLAKDLSIKTHTNKMEILDTFFKTKDIGFTPFSWGSNGGEQLENYHKYILEDLISALNVTSDLTSKYSYSLVFRVPNKGELLKFLEVTIPCSDQTKFSSQIIYSTLDRKIELNKFTLGCGSNIIPLNYSPLFYSSDIIEINLHTSMQIPITSSFNFYY